MRIVREILKHVPTKFGRDGAVSEKRIGVLAWCAITPVQMRRLNPPVDFHDVPNADRDDLIDGAVTVLMPLRFKGQRRQLPQRELEPLTPYGVDAMRAFAAEPKAWGKFSTASLNKAFKAACGRAQIALKADGIDVDLSRVTLYHLKHSLASAMELASGLVDRRGKLKASDGVRQMLGHARGQTTTVYTRATVEPLKLEVSKRTALYLDELFTRPLKPAPKASKSTLRRVK
jgi:hypothetical protein